MTNKKVSKATKKILKDYEKTFSDLAKYDSEGVHEPKDSIEGVLWDVKAGVMEVHDALEEIMWYFEKRK